MPILRIEIRFIVQDSSEHKNVVSYYLDAEQEIFLEQQFSLSSCLALILKTRFTILGKLHSSLNFD